MNGEVTDGPVGITITLTLDEAREYVYWRRGLPYDTREGWFVASSLGNLIENTLQRITTTKRWEASASLKEVSR